jgi:lysophospholipase L1-like esterase
MNGSAEAKHESQGLKAIYLQVAIYTLNTLVILLVLNLLLAVFFRVTDTAARHAKPPRESRRSRVVYTDLDAYTTIDKAQANRFLDEQYRMGRIGFVYRPWVQFGNPHFEGDLLTTDRSGFRVTPGQVESDSPVRVYVFGGSTTFGYGVPNAYTIPSQLQQLLNKRQSGKTFVVRNYGQGYHYSSQELLRFMSLLKSGDVPRYAVFIDGANDAGVLSKGLDQPVFTETFSQAWDVANHRAEKRKPSQIPMVRLAQTIRWRAQDKAKARAAAQESAPSPTDAQGARFVVDCYKQNQRVIRALCKEYGVVPLFVWQPIPFYKYDRSLHHTFPYEGEAPKFWELTYEEMARYSAPDFLYLGDLLDGVREKIFVDDVHYNEKYNGLIAQAIAERIIRDDD